MHAPARGPRTHDDDARLNVNKPLIGRPPAGRWGWGRRWPKLEATLASSSRGVAPCCECRHVFEQHSSCPGPQPSVEYHPATAEVALKALKYGTIMEVARVKTPLKAAQRVERAPCYRPVLAKPLPLA